MDHHTFLLPGAIEVKVLRFLASLNCTESVMAMIKEVPGMTHFVPPRPYQSMTDGEYMAYINRFFSVDQTLTDVFGDYAKAKGTAQQLLQKIRPPAPLPGSGFGFSCSFSDSLSTQLKALEGLVGNGSALLAVPAPSAPAPPTTTTSKKQSSTMETQTEDIPLIDLSATGAADVPMMFYNSLIADPERLASAINEHILGSNASENQEQQTQKNSRRVDTEVDKFLCEMLNGEDSLGSMLDINNGNAGGEDSFSFRSLFNDVDSLIGKEVNQGDKCTAGNAMGGLTQSSSSSTLQNAETAVAVSTTALVPVTPASIPAPIKRITPKSLPPTSTPPAVRPNPVFEVKEYENRIVTTPENGGKAFTATIQGVTHSPKVSDWTKLGRRSIQPKIPSSERNKAAAAAAAPLATPVKSVTQKSASSSCNRRKRATPMKLTPDKSGEINFLMKIAAEKAGQRSTKKNNDKAESCKKKGTTVSQTPQQTKPSTTPLDTSPFPLPRLMLVTADSVEKPQTTPAGTEKPISSMNIDVTEVTPILATMVSSSKSRARTGTVSVSAQKSVVPTAASTKINLNKKSFSTPRKKHVRNLSFKTPDVNSMKRLGMINEEVVMRNNSFTEGATKSNKRVVVDDLVRVNAVKRKKTEESTSASVVDKEKESRKEEQTKKGEPQQLPETPVDNSLTEEIIQPPTPLMEVEIVTTEENQVRHSKMRKTKTRKELTEELFGVGMSSSDDEHDKRKKKRRRSHKATTNKNQSLPPARKESSGEVVKPHHRGMIPPTLLPSSAIFPPFSRPERLSQSNLKCQTPSHPIIPTPKATLNPRRVDAGDILAAQSMLHLATPLGSRKSNSPPKKKTVSSTPAVTVTRVAPTDSAVTNSNKTPFKNFVLPTTAHSPSVLSALKQSTTTTTSQLSSATITPTLTTSTTSTLTDSMEFIYPTDEITIQPFTLPPPLQTPGKLLPFNITPGPIGFPDPTPVKENTFFDFPNEQNKSNKKGSNYPLITPVKDVSPPPSFSLPPTPRIVVINDASSSNSNSNSNGGWTTGQDFLNGGREIQLTMANPVTPGKGIVFETETRSSAKKQPVVVQQPESVTGIPSMTPSTLEETTVISNKPPSTSPIKKDGGRKKSQKTNKNTFLAPPLPKLLPAPLPILPPSLLNSKSITVTVGRPVASAPSTFFRLFGQKGCLMLSDPKVLLLNGGNADKENSDTVVESKKVNAVIEGYKETLIKPDSLSKLATKMSMYAQTKKK